MTTLTFENIDPNLDIGSLSREERKKLAEDYLTFCFKYKKRGKVKRMSHKGVERTTFFDSLLLFISLKPNISKRLWEKYPRAKLLTLINAPNKKKARLSKCTFDEILPYIRLENPYARTERGYTTTIDLICFRENSEDIPKICI